MRAALIELLGQLGQDVIDAGTNSHTNCDYPEIAEIVARKVSTGDVDRGILICGSGLGMCIVANKVPGVRAAPCHDELTAEMSRRHNDLNVLCLAGGIVSDDLLQRMIEIWLKTPFEGGRHARRLQKIAQFECRPAVAPSDAVEETGESVGGQ